MRVWMSRWGGHGFPLNSWQRTFSYEDKRVTVLINIRSFIICPEMVDDVVCVFRTYCMLSDASRRTRWSQLTQKGASFYLFFSPPWKHGMSWRSSTENESVTRQSQVNACFPEKKLLIVATFMFRCVSSWTINCHTGYDRFRLENMVLQIAEMPCTLD